MENTKLIDQDSVLRLKIIIVVVYGVLFVLLIVFGGDPASPLASQLVLQLGSVLNGTLESSVP